MVKRGAVWVAVGVLGFLNFGCLSRFVSEGVGTARGASGKFVGGDAAGDFSRYKGLEIAPITVAPHLGDLDRMALLIQNDLEAVAARNGLRGDETPSLRLSGEIIHYETASSVDTVVGPLEEVIVRAAFVDAETGEKVAETNLIGRARATTASGDRNLSAGVGKALDEWLERHRLR